MNGSHDFERALGIEYLEEFRRGDKKKPQESRRANYSRAESRPIGHNGIDRRRKKRYFGS